MNDDRVIQIAITDGLDAAIKTVTDEYADELGSDTVAAVLLIKAWPHFEQAKRRSDFPTEASFGAFAHALDQRLTRITEDDHGGEHR